MPYNQFLLHVNLTELGVEDHYDGVVEVARRHPTAPPLVADDAGTGLVADVRARIDGLLREGKTTEALQVATETLRSVRAMHRDGSASMDTLSKALIEHARVLLESGRVQQAGVVAREILEDMSAITDRRVVSVAATIIGSAHDERGEHGQALAHFESALRETDEYPGSSDWERAVSRHNLASFHSDMRNYATARRYLHEAEDLLRADHREDKGFHGKILRELAATEARLGDPVAAFGHLDEAERLLPEEEVRDRPSGLELAALDTARAEIYAGISDHQAAADSLRRALERERALRGAGHPLLYLPENRLALALQQVGQLEEARELLHASLDKRVRLFGKSSPQAATAYNNLAIVAAADGDLHAAVGYYEECLRIRRPLLEPSDHNLIDTLAGLGSCRSRLGDTDAAVDLLAEAVRGDFAATVAYADATLSDLRRVSQSRSWVLGQLVTVALQESANPAHRAAAVTALINAKALATGLTAARPHLGREQRSTIGRQFVAQRVATLATRGPRGREFGEYVAQLRQLASMLDRPDGSTPAGDAGTVLPYLDAIEELREQLPAGAAFIDISVFVPGQVAGMTESATGLRCVASVISSVGVEAMADLGPVGPISDLVAEFREEMQMFTSLPAIPAIEDASARRVIGIGRHLYDIALAPLEAVLGCCSFLLLSLEGPLSQVPIAALVDGKGRFAAERWAISYLASVYDLHPHIHTRSEQDVVIFADPAFGTPSERHRYPRSSGGSAPLSEALAVTWTALHGTTLELKAVQDAVGRDRVTAYTGAAASKSQLLKTRHPRVLHLATHAYYVADTPVAVIPPDPARPSGGDLRVGASAELRSGIVLAGANERRHLGDSASDDGVVTSLELSTALDLSGTELVILSACDTGVGDALLGDAVHGVRHACHAAGARSVIACLWPIIDEHAASLVGSLYRRLAHDTPLVHALHEATLEAMEAARRGGRMPHPHRWAAFTLSGGLEAALHPVLSQAASVSIDRPRADES